MCCRYPPHAFLLASIGVLLVSGSAAARPPRVLAAVSTSTGGAAKPPLEPRPTTANCSELFFEQRVDPFDFSSDAAKWLQRYFVCSQFAEGGGTTAPPILFLGERWPPPLTSAYRLV